MTTFSFPDIRPSIQEWTLRNFTAVHESPFSGQIATQDRDGEHWLIRMSWDDLEGTRRHELLAFLYKLNGAQHRFTVKDFAFLRLGVGGGTPLVFGASQTGKILNIDGGPVSVTNWLKAGDKISVAGLLHSVDLDVNTDGAGLASITLTPRIFVSPADNDPVEIDSPTNSFVMMNQALPVSTSSTTSSVAIEGRSAL